MWSLVLRIGAHPGANLPVVVYAYPSSFGTCGPFTSYDPVSIYMYSFMTSAAPTQPKLMVYNTCTKRTRTHYIYRKVYREINGQKSKNVCKHIFIYKQ